MFLSRLWLLCVRHRRHPVPRTPPRFCHDWPIHQAAAGVRFGLADATRAMRGSLRQQIFQKQPGHIGMLAGGSGKALCPSGERGPVLQGLGAWQIAGGKNGLPARFDGEQIVADFLQYGDGLHGQKCGKSGALLRQGRAWQIFPLRTMNALLCQVDRILRATACRGQ